MEQQEDKTKGSNLRWWILLTVIIGTFLGRLDQTIVNLALPKIISDFGITVSAAGWIATAYILANAVFVPIWGKLGDTIGRKKVYIIGFSIFILGSVLAGLSWNLSSMIVFRIIQSIPSPKAEPLKRWLAKVGYERVQEIENPELATKRTRLLYKLKGYPEDWIEKRMRGIAIREELTNEWKKRGAEHDKDYEILTAEISQATFGIKPNEYKKIKGLKRENLRDHMTDAELVFTALAELSTRQIAETTSAKGLGENKDSARKGGTVAKNARLELEPVKS